MGQQNKTLILFAIFTAGLTCITGCSDDGSNTNQNSNVQQDAAMTQDGAMNHADAGQQPDAAGQHDAAVGPHPTSAACTDCHTLSNYHSGLHDWPSCNGCHSLPGVPSFPSPHQTTGCTGCHTLSTSHTGYQTYVPTGCIDCHTP